MKKLTSITRAYECSADRERAIKALKRLGFNYFVCYHDVASCWSLQFGVATWVAAGSSYILR